jgi:hypothetical protein
VLLADPESGGTRSGGAGTRLTAGGGVAGEPSTQALRDELLELLASPLEPALDDTAFTAIALRVFAFQFENNAPYRAYCEQRRRTPDRVQSWRDVPAVPTAAFKALPLVAGDARRAQAVFRTSGTSAGPERRGTRYLLDLALYHRAATSFFAASVLPDDAVLPFLSLMPPAAELGDSSLAHMIDLVCDRFGAPGSERYATIADGLCTDALVARLRLAESTGEPVCMLGTSLAFVHLLDALNEAAAQLRLPAGSRLMDTGGYKGVGRHLEPRALRAAYEARLGLEPTHCVNEYGMTELCSQFYDDALRRRVATPAVPIVDEVARDRKVGPRWVRSRVVDPSTLEPVRHGDVGILQHVDLANLDAVLAIQTEDLAREVAGGFVLLGRDLASPPRGCSIALDELLQAARRTRIDAP